MNPIRILVSLAIPLVLIIVLLPWEVLGHGFAASRIVVLCLHIVAVASGIYSYKAMRYFMVSRLLRAVFILLVATYALSIIIFIATPMFPSETSYAVSIFAFICYLVSGIACAFVSIAAYFAAKIQY
ncbi:MAG: hypothetical protein Q4P66_02940 [Actinomycetaceae bacterium]|nr:hypothetical protein [Actinomycetaceae bacterium]